MVRERHTGLRVACDAKKNGRYDEAESQRRRDLIVERGLDVHMSLDRTHDRIRITLTPRHINEWIFLKAYLTSLKEIVAGEVIHITISYTNQLKTFAQRAAAGRIQRFFERDGGQQWIWSGVIKVDSVSPEHETGGHVAYLAPGGILWEIEEDMRLLRREVGGHKTWWITVSL